MSAGSVCKVILIGNVVRDPVLKETATGKKVANFSVAVNRNKDEADFHNVVVWDKLATVVESYVQKGKKVYVEGRLQNRTYDDKEGNKKYITEIVATELVLLGSKSDQAPESTATTPTTTTTPAPEPDITDDF